MPRILATILACASWLLICPGTAQARDPAVRAEFQREHPCPVTGRTRGPCRGFVVDHVIPLCAGGPDHPANMQWQTIEAARIKDREEMRQCAALRRGR